MSTIASAVFATSLATIIPIAITSGKADAVDECQSAPKGAVPAGGHWYYRMNHKTNRKCWYVADVQSGQAIPKKDPSSPRPQADAEFTASAANAHAELVDIAPAQRSVVSTALPDAAQNVTGAAAQTLPDSQAFLRAPATSEIHGSDERNIVVADESVNVNPDLPEASASVQTAAADHAAAAQGTATQSGIINPLRTVLGWILIILGVLVVAGCLTVRYTSGVQIERRDPIGT